MGIGVGLAAALLVGCMRCSRAEKFESYVDEPTTIEAIEALRDPPDVVVELTEGPKESAGSASCGHSPVCIILLPAVVEDLAFPVHFKHATVKTRGKTSYEAVFHHNGQFFRATARDAKVAREIQLLELTSLDRNVVVEVGRAPLDAHGKAGKLSRTRIQSQVDLLTPYSKLLGDPKQSDRAIALVEVARVLGDDGFPLVKARLGDPKELGDLKREFFYRICQGERTLFERRERGSELMRAFAEGRPPAAAAFAALECFQTDAEARAYGLSLPLAEARPLLEATLRALGETATTREFLGQAEGLARWAGAPKRHDPEDGREVKAALAAALPACGPPLRRNYLALMFDAPLSEGEWRALAVDTEFGPSVYPLLDANHAADFAFLLRMLAEVAPADAGPLLSALSGRAEAPTSAERALLLALYAKPLGEPGRAALLGRLAASPEADRSVAAAWLREHLKPAPRDKPADSSQGYLPERPSDGEVVRHAALAALGSTEDQLPLLRYVARYQSCSPSNATAAAQPVASRAPRCGFESVYALGRHDYIGSMEGFAQYALGLAGCGLLDAERVERALKDDNKARSLCP